MKITVIATGFGPPARAARAGASAAQTPVDMTQYADQRLRAGDGAARCRRPAIARRQPRLSIDAPAGCSSCRWRAAAAARRRPRPTRSAAASTPDFELSSTFDVPAFLRRQEG